MTASLVVSILCALWTATGSGYQRAQPPAVIDTPVIREYIGMPQTPAELLERSDAAAVVRFLRADDAPARGRAQTRYLVLVQALLKAHPHLAARAIVCRPIGVVQKGPQRLRVFEPGFDAFALNQEYVLFLTWSERDECYWPSFGRDAAGVFDADGRFRPAGGGPALRELAGTSKDAVIQEVVSKAKLR